MEGRLPPVGLVRLMRCSYPLYLRPNTSLAPLKLTSSFALKSPPLRLM